jgi:aryl-alcohol dehydrogenase-like predicted oxidoreductase
MQNESTVELGRGLQIEPLGVGTWAWGTKRLWGYGGDYSEDDVVAAFHESLKRGVRLFDTAEIYGSGASERIIGSLIDEGDRSEPSPLIATKFAPLPYRFSPRSLLKALDGSLKRLRIETIALYQIHFPYSLLKIEGLMDALAEAVKEGKVRHVGVSNYSAAQMRRAHERLARHDVPLASNQVHYSLLNRVPETNGVLDACRDLDVTLIAYSPLAQGLLTGKYAPGARPAGLVRRLNRSFDEANLRKIGPLLEALHHIGEAYEKTSSQVALNWLVTQRGVLAIPGAKNERQARENAGALGWALAPEEVGELEILSRRLSEQGRQR